ncbi:competence-damaged protein-domain-containing protein [Chytridium lagenaria]|nr:competence-damaged protein-domain-containing protein [Chytridium lagenaria]
MTDTSTDLTIAPHSLFPLCQRILTTLSTLNHTLSIAESLTGGLVSARLTDVPGASKTIKGGIVSYTNEVKNVLLGVPMTVLNSVGPVSMECAEAMARGVKMVCRSEWGLATTGWAGNGLTVAKLLSVDGLIVPNDPGEVAMRAASPFGMAYTSDSVNVLAKSTASVSDLAEDGLVYVSVVGPGSVCEVRRFVFQRGGRWETREDALKAALELLMEKRNGGYILKTFMGKLEQDGAFWTNSIRLQQTLFHYSALAINSHKFHLATVFMQMPALQHV